MNEQFLNRMQTMIPDEFEAFMASLDQDLYKALRINTKKVDPDRFPEPGLLGKPSPFADHSWYVDRPLGLDPYHICGLFYLQEPSASGVVGLLDVQKDDLVLDLCAAPGSKTTQIAQKLESGMLVCNEIDAKRAQALLSNLERMGVVNFALTNSESGPLCAAFENCFDKVLVDAPCSGEGMLKKHAIVAQTWSMDNILMCAARQKEIVSNAVRALKGGGVLVYSTCTYAKEENEEVVAWILERFPEMELVDCGAAFGRPGLKTPGMDASKVRRVFPMDGGEGQFMAKFVKKGDASNTPALLKNEKPNATERAFLREQVEGDFSFFHHKMEKLFRMEYAFLDFGKLKVVRQGVLVGEMKKNRFEPAHAFYMAADTMDRLKNKVSCGLCEMDAYMHGEQIRIEGEPGFVGVCFDGYPFGFGKSDGHRINNKIPKGMRLLPKSHVRMDGEEQQ